MIEVDTCIMDFLRSLRTQNSSQIAYKTQVRLMRDSTHLYDFMRRILND
jgi:hypothetical protein